MSYKLLHDYKSTLSFHIENEELWTKMPDYSPRFRAKPRAGSWVAPDAEFFASHNFEGDPTVMPPDVCTWSTGNLVFSEYAYKVFKSLLERSGEFLPTNVNGSTYYLFNTLFVIPEEGVNKDKAVDVIDSGVHLGLDNVSFNEDVLDGAVIFKSSTDRLVHSYGTDEFKNFYDKNGFKGLTFEKVMCRNSDPA